MKKTLHWLPVDLPKFFGADKVIKDFTKDFVAEKAKAFYVQKLTEEIDGYNKVAWKSTLTKSQQELSKYIDQYLPFDHLVNIKIHLPNRAGSMHVDFVDPSKNIELFLQNRELDPCGYRMILSGNRHGELAVQTKKGIVYPEMPLETDWYVIGGTHTPHCLKIFDPSRYILFCHAWINPEDHNKIMERSLKKYSKYAIWD